jgi:hypothetical protein
MVRVQDARSREGASETMTLGSFIRRCAEYFAWSGCLVDQPFQDRLADGMLRCYFCCGEVVGFCQQWPRGRLDQDAHQGTPPASVMDGPDVPAYQRLRRLAETQWVPEMIATIGLAPRQLPVIWDADFLYGSKTATGDGTYVLGEINVSAVWPFPPMAAPTVAAAAVGHIQAARTSRGPSS